MKKNIRLFLPILLLVSFLLSNCGEDAIVGPTQINLTNTSIYERLPANSNVATLSTDILDSSPNFRLVNGEGDTNNGDFVIKGTILQTTKRLQFSDGVNRSIRVQVTANMETFEKAINIQVNEFVGTYPRVTSPSFKNNEEMPREFGMNNGNVSPDLDIMDVPSNTVSMVISMNDLDDGNSYHWVVWNIPPDKVKFQRRESETLGGNIVVGNNSFGTGYTGPFPPRVHRYQTSVFFLSGTLDLTPSDFQTLLPKMTGKVIAQASIIGKYTP